MTRPDLAGWDIGAGLVFGGRIGIRKSDMSVTEDANELVINNECDSRPLVIKLIEECAELVQAVCKGDRFGWTDWHPDRGISNLVELQKEWADVNRAFDKLMRNIIELREGTKVPKFVTLCGSTKYKQEFMMASKVAFESGLLFSELMSILADCHKSIKK